MDLDKITTIKRVDTDVIITDCTQSNISSDDSTLSISSDWSVTIDMSEYTGFFAEEVDTITLDALTSNTVPWEDFMLNPEKLKRMCEQYPALSKAYENFKTVYTMVEQDWKGNHEDDDDELFF